MPTPPKTPPASDLEGVRQDEVDNVDAAIAAGQDSGDLAKAREQAKGRPARSEDEANRDDRSR